MTSVETLHAITTIGSGSGVIDPTELSIDNIQVEITRTPPDADSHVKETHYLDSDDIADYVGIGPPEQQNASYDVVIVISGLPAPDFVRQAADDNIDITVVVEDTIQARAAGCPNCGRDLRETFENWRCQSCGHYFDKSNLPWNAD